MSDKITATELEAKLGYKKTNFYEKADEATIQAAYDYAPGYMAYLDAAKTEREAVTVTIGMAEAEGYVPYTLGMPLEVGGKYYYNNRGRNLYLFRIGSEPINNGIRIVASHVDVPRIDVKQSPLYEDGGMAFFKTHYYGGIRKYQWVNGLAVVNFLNFLGDVCLNSSLGFDSEDILRILRTFSEFLTFADEVAFADFKTRAVRNKILADFACFRILDNSVLRVLHFLEGKFTVDFRKDSNYLRMTCFEKFLNSGKTLCNV